MRKNRLPSVKRGLIIVVSAPSGSGKTTLCKKLLETNHKLIYSISATTRAPRAGEFDGKDYFFTNVKIFKKMIKNNEFVEWAEVHGNYYGTPKKYLEKTLSRGYDVILDIDVQGGEAIKNTYPESVLIFIAPPSLDELKKRLVTRAQDNSKTIALRLKNAQKEMSYVKFYDYLVINDKLDTALDQLKSIIRAEHTKIKRHKKPNLYLN
ncbi:MAG: guanylate kinase [Elusimicrobia bacterium RIFOXYA2_FULL_39_19]|nr:MAG: guanylate kinase [Elusimicrobia bacterium RIFOXYA2_FULL_39_19]